MSENKGLSFFWLFAIGILVLLAAVAPAIFRAGGTPDITIAPALPVIGKRTPVKIEVSEPRRGLSHIKVEVAYAEKVETVAEKSYQISSAYSLWGPRTERDIISVAVGRETIPGLKGGSATIRVTADRAGTWLRRPDPAVQELVMPVRLTPPALQVNSIQSYVAQGGCEAVVYRIGESAVRDGVQSGSWWFPGYPLPGAGKQDRFALFAVPYDMDHADVRLVAEDAAGNAAQISFVDKFFPKPPKTDNLEITDAFMGKVVPEILSQSPEIQDRGNLLDNYLAINGELRRKQNEELKELAKKSRSEFLWSEPFLMMRNAKVMSAFADQRTYHYQNKIVDHQDHLGFDLAVTQQAEIPASNSGVVLLAKFFGIYGNAVMIDHGYGLLTLYGHLSSIGVTEGQKVGRGDIIGRTGQTGLAAGDHLHFTTLLQGLPVNPVEWWDGHWIQDRIAKKLGPAMKFNPDGK
jgi:murein DD-endopeptidase MepM/ murein hydrolase activator NlpD